MSVQVEVVDAMFSRPAAGVPVRLLREVDSAWTEPVDNVTDETGRASRLETASRRGRYRLKLSLDEYFAGLGMQPFQSRVDVVFRVFQPGEQVRLLLMVTPSSCVVCRLTDSAASAAGPADET